MSPSLKFNYGLYPLKFLAFSIQTLECLTSSDLSAQKETLDFFLNFVARGNPT